MASVKVGVLLGKLAAKAGVDTSTEAWKPILALDTEITDTEATAFEEKLLTIEAAKSNKDLGMHFKAQVLQGADAKINEIIAEYGLTPDDDFKNDKNTYEKIARVTKMVKEATAKKAGATKGDEIKEWAETEKKLNAELKELKTQQASKEAEYNTKYETLSRDFGIKTLLSGKKLNLPDEMDSNLRMGTALSVVDKQLAQDGFIIKIDETGNLGIFNKDTGTPAHSKTHEAWKPDNYINGALAQNKLLKINDDVKKDTNGQIIIGNTSKGNPSVLAEIDAQLAEFDK